MRVLLDTHAFIWRVNGDAQLSRSVQEILDDAGNEILFSAAVSWEIALKVKLNRLFLAREDGSQVVAGDVRDFVSDQSRVYTQLPITTAHTLVVATLPLHHTDPFDRLLVSQAMLEDLVVLTRDPYFVLYGIKTFW